MDLAFPVSMQCVSRLVLPRSSSDTHLCIGVAVGPLPHVPPQLALPSCVPRVI